MARLNAAERRHLPASDFAGPHRSYPIENIGHARAAVRMAAKNASPALEKRVDAAVHRKYPSIKIGGK